MKLEFAIQTAFEGLKMEYKSNEESEWHKSIGDLRPCIAGLKPKPQESFFGLSLIKGSSLYSKRGIMVYACYFNPSSRGDEYIAAYLFVPSRLFFSLPDEIIYSKLYTLLSVIKNDPNEDAYSILKKSHFDQEYEDKGGLDFMMLSYKWVVGAGYAVHYYSTDQDLKDLLNPRFLFQRGYMKYRSVVFAQKQALKDERTIKTFPQEKLRKLTFVTFHNPNGYLVSFEGRDGDFCTNLSTFKFVGEEVTIVCRRDGFMDQTKKERITENGVIDLRNLQWCMQVEKERFRVTDKEGDGLKYEFSVIGKKDGILSEEEAKDVTIEFRAKNYQTMRIHANLITQRFIHVAMPHEMVERTYEVKTETGETVEFEILEKKGSEETSPLAGYRVKREDSKQNYILVKKKSLLPLALAFLAGILVGAGIFLLCNARNPLPETQDYNPTDIDSTFTQPSDTARIDTMYN